MEATGINGQPGFFWANLHESLDGSRVVNYARWRSRERSRLRNPEAVAHIKEVQEFARSFEPYLHEVSSMDEAPPS